MTVVPSSFDQEYQLGQAPDGTYSIENRSCSPGATPAYLSTFEVFGGKSPVEIRLLDEVSFRLEIDPNEPRRFRVYHVGGCVSGPALRVVEAGQQTVVPVEINVTYEAGSATP